MGSTIYFLKISDNSPLPDPISSIDPIFIQKTLEDLIIHLANYMKIGPTGITAQHILDFNRILKDYNNCSQEAINNCSQKIIDEICVKYNTPKMPIEEIPDVIKFLKGQYKDFE